MDWPQEDETFYIDITPQSEAAPVSTPSGTGDKVLHVRPNNKLSDGSHKENATGDICKRTGLDSQSKIQVDPSKLYHLSNTPDDKPLKGEHGVPVDRAIIKDDIDKSLIKPECSEETNELLSLKQLENPSFRCVICDQVCSTKSQLLAHCEQTHSLFIQCKQTTSVDHQMQEKLTTNVTSDTTQEGTKSPDLQEVACEESYKCAYCGARARCKSDLKLHVKIKHLNSNQPKDDLEKSEPLNNMLKPTDIAKIMMSPNGTKSRDLQDDTSDLQNVKKKNCNSKKMETSPKHLMLQPTTAALQTSQKDSGSHETVNEGLYQSFIENARKWPFQNLKTIVRRAQSDYHQAKRKSHDNQATASKRQKVQSQNLLETTSKGQSLDQQATATKGPFLDQTTPRKSLFEVFQATATEKQSKDIHATGTKRQYSEHHAALAKGHAHLYAALTKEQFQATDVKQQSKDLQATVTEGVNQNQQPTAMRRHLQPTVSKDMFQDFQPNTTKRQPKDFKAIITEGKLQDLTNVRRDQPIATGLKDDPVYIPDDAETLRKGPLERIDSGVNVQFKKNQDLNVINVDDKHLAEADTLYSMFLRFLQSSYCTNEYELALLWKQSSTLSNKCPLCLKHIKSKTNIIAHLRTHKDEIILAQQGRICICSFCWMTMETPELLVEHVLRNHKKRTSQLVHSNNASVDTLLMGYCLRSQDELVLKWHKVLEVVQISFFCEYCGSHFPCLEDLKHHTLNGKKCILEDITFQCETCQFTCSNYKELKCHNENHLALRTIFCPICKEFFSKGYYELMTHMNSVHKAFDNALQKSICHICYSLFRTESTLSNHMHKEHKVGHWKSCHRCGKVCTRKNLIKHYNCAHHRFIKEEHTSGHAVVIDWDTKESLCAKCKCPTSEEAHICTLTEDFDDHKWFCCTRCDDVKYFRKLQGLVAHNKSQHNIEHIETSVDTLDIPPDTDECGMYKVLQANCKATFKNTQVQFQSEEIQCPLCTAVIHVTNLYNHITGHRNEVTLCVQSRSYMCSWCFMCCSDTTDLVKHARKCHPDHMGKLETRSHAIALYTLQQSVLKKWLRVLDVIKDGFACNSCHKHFPTTRAVLYHKHVGCNSVTGNVCCSYCKHECNSYFEYMKHFVNMHINAETVQNCAVCDKSISTQALLEHIHDEHMQLLLAKCTLCGKRFRSDNGVKWHKVKFHKCALEYMCEICGYKSVSKTLWEGHMNKHTGGTYKCSYCDATFQHSISKSRHERTHKNKPKFTCPQCPSTFVQKASLNRHIKTHHENVRYACDICGKTYSQTHPIMQHRKKCHPGAWKRSIEELLVKKD